MELPSCAWPANAPSLEAFVALVSREGARLYRDLPWRNIDDAYAVLVSEVMLQQTQVKRVLGRWERFLAKFPTPDALAMLNVALFHCSSVRGSPVAAFVTVRMTGTAFSPSPMVV